jgi:hypothetical protein
MDDLAGARGTSTDDPSGALRAREAHDAGAVVPPVELPVWSVWVEFRVHGTRERAQAIADKLSAVALALDVEPPVAVTVTGHA